MAKLNWDKLRGKTWTDKIEELGPYGIIFAEKIFHMNGKACHFVTEKKGIYDCKGYKIITKGKTIEKTFTSAQQKTKTEFNKFVKLLINAEKGDKLYLLGKSAKKKVEMPLGELTKTDEFGGQQAGGKKINKGNEFEKFLHERLVECLGGKVCQGKYSSQTGQLIEAIQNKTGKALNKSNANHAGGANTSRPLTGTSQSNLHIAPSSPSGHGPKLTDISLEFPDGTKDINLSLKFGNTLTFMNAGCKTFLTQKEIDEGMIKSAMGKAILGLFKIENKTFCNIWAKKNPTRNLKKTVTLDKSKVSKFLKTAIGAGYWMVHGNEPLGSGAIDLYIMDTSANNKAASINTSATVYYGGKSSKGGSRVDVEFSSPYYDFNLNIRSKSSKTAYPTNIMLDYSTKSIPGKLLLK